MNNILPLLQKAIVEYKSNGDTPEDYTLTIPEQIINRFAELIIQECVNVCDDVEDNYFKGVDMNTDISIGAGVCSWEIEKHFEIRV